MHSFDPRVARQLALPFSNMASSLQRIKFVALVRRADSVIVAEYGKDGIKNDLDKLVQSKAFTEQTIEGKHISLKAQGNMFHLIGDENGLVVVAVTDGAYSQATVYSSLIPDIRNAFCSKGYDWKSTKNSGLSRKFRGDMARICKDYDDEESKNKIKKLRASVDQTKGVMAENIRKQLENIETTEVMDENAANLADSARTFNKKAKRLAWREWLMLQKLKCMIFLVLLVLIGVIIGLVCADGACSPKSEPTPSNTTIISG